MAPVQRQDSEVVVIASGGVYTERLPIRDRDIATQYLRLILSVIGSPT